jgi:predicted PurR-regulated permease PerM
MRGRALRFTQIHVLAAIFGGIYICYLLVAPFLSALTWALVLAVLFTSVHRAIEARLRSPNFSATISVLMVALIVVVPSMCVAERLISEAAKGAIVIQAQVESSIRFSAARLRAWSSNRGIAVHDSLQAGSAGPRGMLAIQSGAPEVH